MHWHFHCLSCPSYSEDTKSTGTSPLLSTYWARRIHPAVEHLLLQSFSANEAIFQLMMLAYNWFLLFKIDFAGETEYQQQIKTFRLKFIFLVGKIIRTPRSVVMKLSEKYPYQEIYEKSSS